MTAKMKYFLTQTTQQVQWLWLATGYFAAALLGQWEPLVPDYASAIWPPAGVALAGLLLSGKKNWPGIWLGAMVANLFRIGAVLGGEWLTPGIWLQSAAIAAGSTLAAWLGAAMITRFVNLERLFFSERQTLAMLLLGGPVSCLVSALIGPLTLLSNGIITPESLPFNIFAWWIGDTIGVLLFTPLILIWSPALGMDWQRPRWFVTTGLLLVLAVVVTLLAQVNSLERKKMQARMGEQATLFTNELNTTFQLTEEILYSISNFVRLTPHLNAELFGDFNRRLLERNPGISAMEWIPRVESRERRSLEELAGQWYPGFRITERDATGVAIQAEQRSTYYPVALVEPLRGNEMALGYDLGSNPDRLATLETARDSGKATATARLNLVQDQGKKVGILMLVPTYLSMTPPTTREERRASLLGFALGVLRIDDLVAVTLTRWKESGLAVRIIDSYAPAKDRLIYQSLDQSSFMGNDILRTFRVADRIWQIHFDFSRNVSVRDASIVTWLTLVGGLCFAALLEAFVLLVVGRDILTRHLVQQRTAELEEAKKELQFTAAFQRAILDSAQSTIISTDTDGIIRSFNNAAREQLGYEPHELIGVHTPAILHVPAEVARRAEALSQELGETIPPGFEVFVAKTRRGEPDEQEWSYIRKDGSRFPVSLTVTAMRNEDGTISGFLGVGVDITQRKQDEARLALAHKVIENTSEAIMITNTQGIITYINNAFERITGWNAQEVVGCPSNITKSGHHDRDFYIKMWHDIRNAGSWSGEIWDRRKNGEVFPKWLSISAIRDASGQLVHFVGIFTDITQKKEAERKLEQLAYYDPLTGLPNRALFRERMEQAISSAMRHKSGVALFFIDLDRFKMVNDTLGHAAGDELLKIVADRLQARVRSSDTVARLGGDEFTVIITEVALPEQVSPFAQKMIDSLLLPMTIHNQEVNIGGSIGIALYPGDGENFDTLTKHADMAMYLAKERGRNNFQFFSRELQTRIQERISLEGDLGKALENRELLLHYQPKFDAHSLKLVGMESLVRWEKPGQGLVSPARFIPLAEETGLILPIGAWILMTSCRDTMDWLHGDQCPLQVAVNLSARQFQQPDLIAMIRNTLDNTGLSPECLELEITESMVMGNVEDSVAIMRRLRELGISLAMDDFGTGFSSLSYLKKFPVHTLKIDQAFVRELRSDSSDASIVMAIIGLAKALHLKVVAEGVENAHQLAFLQEHGCDLIQGFHLAKPMPRPAFANFVRQRTGGA